MSHGGKRVGAGRPTLPAEEKKVAIAIRVAPGCKAWLKDKALELDCSLGDVIEHMMQLWREQERKYYGIDDSPEPYIKAFCTEFEKRMHNAMQGFKTLDIYEEMAVAEEMAELSKSIRYPNK